MKKIAVIFSIINGFVLVGVVLIAVLTVWVLPALPSHEQVIQIAEKLEQMPAPDINKVAVQEYLRTDRIFRKGYEVHYTTLTIMLFMLFVNTVAFSAICIVSKRKNSDRLME